MSKAQGGQSVEMDLLCAKCASTPSLHSWGRPGGTSCVEALRDVLMSLWWWGWGDGIPGALWWLLTLSARRPRGRCHPMVLTL